MNENVVDILIYLYENFMEGDLGGAEDQEALRDDLIQAGFPEGEIDKAFHWMDGLVDQIPNPACPIHMPQSLRVFSQQEVARLDLECRGTILFLEQNSILTPDSRERVIERALALDTPYVSAEAIKWIVLLVLMSQPGEEAAFAQMEDMVYNEDPIFLH